MTAYLIRRLIQSVIVLIALSIAIFGLLYLAPGGPLSQILESKRQNARFPVKPEDIERLKKQYDLDLPLWQSYTRWAVGLPDKSDRPKRYGIVRGDLVSPGVFPSTSRPRRSCCACCRTHSS